MSLESYSGYTHVSLYILHLLPILFPFYHPPRRHRYIDDSTHRYSHSHSAAADQRLILCIRHTRSTYEESARDCACSAALRATTFAICHLPLPFVVAICRWPRQASKQAHLTAARRHLMLQVARSARGSHGQRRDLQKDVCWQVLCGLDWTMGVRA